MISEPHELFFLLMLLGDLLSMKVNHDALSLDWNHQTRRFIKLSYFVFRWKRVIQYLHYWWTIPLSTDQIIKTSTLCSNSTAHCLASYEHKNSLRGNGPSARSQFSFTDYHLPLLSHLPLCKTNTRLTMTRVNCQCTDTHALLVLQKKEDVWLLLALSLQTQTRAPLVLQHRRDSCHRPCSHTCRKQHSTQCCNFSYVPDQ